jgi:hypothetical protein
MDLCNGLWELIQDGKWIYEEEWNRSILKTGWLNQVVLFGFLPTLTLYVFIFMELMRDYIISSINAVISHQHLSLVMAKAK